MTTNDSSLFFEEVLRPPWGRLVLNPKKADVLCPNGALFSEFSA